jgi:hypothetical protein
MSTVSPPAQGTATEKTASDAPAWYGASEADAWASGYNSAVEALAPTPPSSAPVAWQFQTLSGMWSNCGIPDPEDLKKEPHRFRALVVAHQPAAGAEREALDWPSREVVAREIRRAMLDNPTDDSFNKRAEKREAIANDVADVIIARFAAASLSPVRSSGLEVVGWQYLMCDGNWCFADPPSPDEDQGRFRQVFAEPRASLKGGSHE